MLHVSGSNVKQRASQVFMASALTFGILGTAILGSQFLASSANAIDAKQAPEVATQVFSFADMVENVKDAVVSVRVTELSSKPVLTAGRGRLDLPEGHPMRRFFEEFNRDGHGQKAPKRRGGLPQGSGFFISADGYLITNHHVIDGGANFEVLLADGNSYQATLIGSDAKTDLALMKVDADVMFESVPLADAAPRVGDWVVAVGNPFGLGGTVTAGIVSAHGRQIGASIYDDFIQIDAPVNKGNSGGPSFNLEGEVVGVNTAIFSPSGGNVGIAFAIPAETVSAIIADLKDDGQVQRGWLGVQIQSLTDDLAQALGLSSKDGAMITDVQPESPALMAGLKVGDVILSVEDDTIDDPKDLARTIAQVEPGETAKMSIWRDGKAQNIEVDIKSQFSDAAIEKADAKADVEMNNARLGVQLAPARDGRGVVIAGVEPGSGAEDKGLRQGQQILGVNGAAVTTPEQVIAAVKSAKADGKKSVILQLETRRGARFVAVPFKPIG